MELGILDVLGFWLGTELGILEVLGF